MSTQASQLDFSAAALARPDTLGAADRPVKIVVRNLNFYYGTHRALTDISLDIKERIVTAFIGPSGCGKSTFIRTLNRMNDVIAGTRVEGQVLIDGQDVYAPRTDVVDLRRKVGMVFQKSNPFPKSIFDNVAYGLKINRLTNSKSELVARVEEALRSEEHTSELQSLAYLVCRLLLE